MHKTTTFQNYLIAFIFILTLNFFLPRLMPGDPLQAIYGDEAITAMTPEMKTELIKRFSLDSSTSKQFIVYITSLLKGDMGYSYYHNAPVLKVIAGALPWTLLLVVPAVLLSTTIGLILGIESGYRRNRLLDKSLLTGLMIISGIPDFFIGILLLLFFGVLLGLAPLAGAVTPYSDFKGFAYLADILKHMALPLTALILVRITYIYLLTRNTVIITLNENFILTARAKGCPTGVIKYLHAGRSSLLPVVTVTGLQLAHLITGTLFIEIVFSYPGTGLLLYKALLTRDYPLLQGILLVITVAVLFINCVTDALYKKLDPRVNYAH